jgi:hypothetical protein
METGQAYAYTGDDPVNGVDPSGDITCPRFVPGCGVVTDVQNEVSGGVSATRSGLARAAQDASNVLGAVSVAGQLVGLASLPFLPEDALEELGVVAVSTLAGDFAAGLEITGCLLKHTSNCTETNESLDVLTLILGLTPAALIPADLRRLKDISDLANWAHSHPVRVHDFLTEYILSNSNCGKIPA